MWCHNAEGHSFNTFWMESEIKKLVGLVINSSFEVWCPTVFDNQCK
jgi:hypothetical protein